jgi:SnoaL-like polyketide cyclase
MDIGSIATERNKAVVAEFDKLIGSDDLSPLDWLCRPDMVNHALAPDRPSGLAGTREFLETMGRHQMTHQAWSRLVVMAEGAYVVQVGGPARPLARRVIFGHRRAAGRLHRDFAAMYRLVEGQIAERWAIRDDLGMLRQLGALPSR